MLEEGKNVDVIYLDFAKAFDKLDFEITLRKLHTMGIRGKILNWLRSFLTGRKQSVCIDGFKSKMEPVISGVPQGSVIGPLLFLILLSDIDSQVLTCSVSSFADDTRVLAGVSDPSDVVRMQADLTIIYD